MKKPVAIIGFASATFAVITQWLMILSKGDQTLTTFLLESIRYYSYMTVWTNILLALCFGAVAFFPETTWGKFLTEKVVQAATVGYILVVGLAYHFLLAGTFDPKGLEWFADLLLHYINPILYTGFWLIFADKERLSYLSSLRWLVWPFTYFIFSLIKGAITDWYPYFFVDVVKLGYPKVLTVSLMLMVGYALLGFAVVWVSRAMTPETLPQEA
ncbi:MAG: Pr6Pr family membrane protein [Bacteroidota bacterium]